MLYSFVIFAIVFAPSVSASAAVTHTNVVLFSPWSSGNLRHGFTVSEKVKGSCWIHSLASERPDAWRCADYSHGIYDPCFVDPSHGRTLACAEGPFSNRVTLLTVAKPLADTMKLTGELGASALGARRGGFAWSTATRAYFVTGATDGFEGERLNYACAKKTGWIFGRPDRSTGVWTARSVQWPEGKRPGGHVSQVGIATGGILAAGKGQKMNSLQRATLALLSARLSSSLFGLCHDTRSLGYPGPAAANERPFG